MDLNPFVERFAANREVIERLAAEMTGAEARWKPDPARWSALEVMNHLADEEAEDFRRRVDIALHAPETPLPPIDPEGWVTSRDYAGRDWATSVARFRRERDASLIWLRGLRDPDWNRSVVHPRAGTLRAGDFLASWLGHDYLHIRQLCRIHFHHIGELAPSFSTDYSGGW